MGQLLENSTLERRRRRVSDSDGRCDINRGGDGRIMHGSSCRAGVQACQGDEQEGRMRGRKEVTVAPRGAEEPLINYDHYYHHRH